MGGRTFVAVLFALAIPVAATAAERVDDVIAEYVAARGGKKALMAVQSVRVTGTLAIDGNEMPYTLEWKRPDKVRLEYEAHGQSSIQAYDGKVGWTVNPAHEGAIELTGARLDRAKARADYLDGPLVDYRKKGHHVTWAGTVDLDGKRSYKLAIDQADGTTGHIFIDVEHHLVVQREEQRSYPEGRIDSVSRPSRYKAVGDLLMAHKFVATLGGPGMQGVHGKRQTNDVRRIELNVDIDDARFTMPEKGDES